MPASDDPLLRWFSQHGWSVGEVGFVEIDGQTNWVVTARRGDQTLLGTSASKAEAWGKAVRLAVEADAVREE